MKVFPTEALTHAPISAVLDLVREHDLAPDQVEKVHIRSLARAADILADPSKYDPRTKETADHSLPYVIAAAIVDRQVTPLPVHGREDHGPDRSAPSSRRSRSSPTPRSRRCSRRCSGCVVTITTTDGQRPRRSSSTTPRATRATRSPTPRSRRSSTPWPTGCSTPPARQKVKDAVWHLETLGSITELMAELVVRG